VKQCSIWVSHLHQEILSTFVDSGTNFSQLSLCTVDASGSVDCSYLFHLPPWLTCQHVCTITTEIVHSWIGLRTGILWGSELLLCAGGEVQIHATREMHCFLEQRLCKNKRSAAKCWQNLLQQEPLKRTEVPNVCCDTCYRGREVEICWSTQDPMPIWSIRVNSDFSPCFRLSVVLQLAVSSSEVLQHCQELWLCPSIYAVFIWVWASASWA
jgi:hypothetical protein